MRSVVVSGSSITNDQPWPTWATWVMHRYSGNNFVDVSQKGLGNEAIITRAVAQAQSIENPLIIVQLTNVDKWDWYVEDPVLLKQLGQEKHKVSCILPTDTSGFWSTGSHFPEWKSYYQKHYLSLQYQMWHTLLLIHWFQMTCKAQHWDNYIIFDSPCLAVTEQQLNKGLLNIQDCNNINLANNSLCGLVYDLIDWSEIYQPGLIGHAVLNNMNWWSPKSKGHPGSLVHWSFVKKIIVPVLDRMLNPCQDLEKCLAQAQRMQNLFDQW